MFCALTFFAKPCQASGAFNKLSQMGRIAFPWVMAPPWRVDSMHVDFLRSPLIEPPGRASRLDGDGSRIEVFHLLL